MLFVANAVLEMSGTALYHNRCKSMELVGNLHTDEHSAGLCGAIEVA